MSGSYTSSNIKVQSDDYIIITMFTSISFYCIHFGASLGGTIAEGNHSFMIFFATNSLAGDLACLLLNRSSRIFINSLSPTTT